MKILNLKHFEAAFSAVTLLLLTQAINRIIDVYGGINLDSSLFTGFIIGLLSAISSCMFVTLGIYLSIIGLNQDANKLSVSINFFLSRIVFFSLMGALLGFAKSIIIPSREVSLITSMVIYFLFILMAFSYILNMRKLQKFLPRFPQIMPLDFSKLNRASFFLPSIAGSLTFFIPCGVLFSAQLSSLKFTTPIESAIYLGLFGIGSTIMLILANVFYNSVSKVMNSRMFYLIIGYYLLFQTLFEIWLKLRF